MLEDIQSSKDTRNIDIDQVGIKDIVYPISLKDRNKGVQSTTAKITMSVMLPHQYKGTHMSRFIEILNKHKDNMDIHNVGSILQDMRERLASDSSFISLSFPYFMEKTAPVSKMKSLMDYNCEFSGSCSEKGLDFVLKVKVPVQSLCPCSKEISEYGAHNQRSIASISVRFNQTVWIEDLIEIAESSASSSIYSLLKREDEKYVTEYAYDNPAFVEDIVRSLAEKLMKDERITWFEVECENMESIHNHNAWARIERQK